MSIINCQISISIKNPAIEKRRIQILPLYALASLAVILFIPSIIIITKSYMYSVIISLVIAVLFFITPFILYKKDKLLRWNTFIRYIQSLILGISGIILLIYHHWLNGINGICWSMIFIFIAQTEKCVFQPQQIIINTNKIKYSHVLYPISIPWNAVEKVVVRTDYISIFKKNGRYIQFEITDDLSDTQLKEMNELCTKWIVDNAK